MTSLLMPWRKGTDTNTNTNTNNSSNNIRSTSRYNVHFFHPKLRRPSSDSSAEDGKKVLVGMDIETGNNNASQQQHASITQKDIGSTGDTTTKKSGSELNYYPDENEDEEGDNSEDNNLQMNKNSSSRSYNGRRFASRTATIAALILLIGAGATAIIVSAGISSAKRDQKTQFERLSSELIHKFDTAVGDYVMAGLWAHQACLNRDTITHTEFRTVYEYLVSTGLELQATGFVLNVTSQQERSAVENRTRLYLQDHRPELLDNYNGFVGYNHPEDSKAGIREEADYYYAVHFVEPIEDIKNQAALDFDINTSPVRRRALEEAVTTGKPALTERLKLLQENAVGTEKYAYSTIIMHPGVPLSNNTPAHLRHEEYSGDVTITVIRIPEVLIRARQNFNMNHHVTLYIFDSTTGADHPPFLGGAHFPSDQEINSDKNGGGDLVTFTNEIELSDLKHHHDFRYLHQTTIPIASREWTFVVVAHQDTFQPDITFVVLGATLILVACMFLALWVVTNHRRMTKIQQVQAHADAERAKLMLDNAREAAQTERELNDFLSHEVRNPISAAISATSFVNSAVRESDGNLEPEDYKCVLEDISIIDSSLQFVNDLLRNMLDMHRASSNQMKINFAPVNLLRDVIEPVASMLYQRGSGFQVLLDCPEDLIVMADRLRLKQTIFNLGHNASKFLSTGFVRLRAEVVDQDNTVRLYVEDSGPGIPQSKREKLFAKFQETLDSLSQGTGMGLSLCKKLVELMKGELWLDEAYDSGVPDMPGARFVIDLKTSPLSADALAACEEDDPLLCASNGDATDALIEGGRELPENLSVLFTDDDWKLRTLFSRALTRATTGWKIREAANGETALRLAEEEKFDIIFLDQYMSSVVKQLLGTETAHALRSRGFDGRICGLSANDVEKPFLKAGANFFVMKPLPTEKAELTRVLFQILDSAGYHVKQKTASKLAPPSLFPSISIGKRRAAENDDVYDVLPKHFKVLFVDDDLSLRNLFSRSLKRAMPSWTIEQAPDGETALELVDNQSFDLIFLDQYMPSKSQSKPLLGTETAHALRAKGYTSLICGLSANDAKAAFFEAGANSFYMKPFPCEKEELIRELVLILGSHDKCTQPILVPMEAPPAPGLPGRQCDAASNQTSAVEFSPSAFKSQRDTDKEQRELPYGADSLPENLSILYVDDSKSLRKMFSRSVERATKGWKIREAESGNEALQLVKSSHFDVIFLDQHLEGSELGTNIVKSLRAEGVNSIICGLSADDIGSKFATAGATCFMMKPFPCEKNELTEELRRVLASAPLNTTSAKTA